jgi:hypothetical protein
MSAWYGWIPNLTGNIFVECDPYRIGAIHLSKDKIENILSKYDLEINADAEYYQFSKKISNEIDGTENKIVVELFKNAVTSVFIFDEEVKDLKASAKCEIDQKGLVKINKVHFENEETEELVKQVYIITRDIYISTCFILVMRIYFCSL